MATGCQSWGQGVADVLTGRPLGLRTGVPQQGPVAQRRFGVSGTKSHSEAEACRLNRHKILSVRGRTSNELDS